MTCLFGGYFCTSYAVRRPFKLLVHGGPVLLHATAHGNPARQAVTEVMRSIYFTKVVESIYCNIVRPHSIRVHDMNSDNTHTHYKWLISSQYYTLLPPPPLPSPPSSPSP